jgi:GntR family transcriptional regulator, transcriptional repressor for pyruvate dehydrogenase complex
MLNEPKTDPVPARFRPVRSVRLSEEIINQIARLVNDGRIKLNERFPSERDLERQWQVSRPVLREAFRVLEMRGVVESRPGGGRYLRSTRVLDPTDMRWSRLEANREALLRLWEAREALECKLAELAAMRATPAQIDAIGRPLRVVASEPPEMLRDLDLNGDFHRSIARAAGNPLLEEMLERLLVESGRVGFKDIVGVEDWATLQGEHQPIFDAIRERDPERARIAMVRHFQNLRDRIAG